MKTNFYLSCLIISSLLTAAPESKLREWPWYGGDAGGNRYSTLSDINLGNVKNLKLAWEWKPGDRELL